MKASEERMAVCEYSKVKVRFRSGRAARRYLCPSAKDVAERIGGGGRGVSSRSVHRLLVRRFGPLRDVLRRRRNAYKRRRQRALNAAWMENVQKSR